MPVAETIRNAIEKSSMIRRMFEEGLELKQKFGADRVYDFTIGNPDLNPPEKFYETVVSLAADRSPGVHGYMPNAGYPDVRRKVAAFASRQQETECTADNIVMTVGAAGALNVILRTLLNPGDEVIVPRPYFAEYGAYVSNHNGVLIGVPSTEDFSLSIPDIEDAITPSTKVILINTPNNPTGRVYSREILEKLGALLNRMKQQGQTMYLVSDEPYRDVVYDGVEVPPLLPIYTETFVVTSFSKTLSLPGERIGYIVQHPAMEGADEVMNGLVMCNRTLGFVNAPALMQRTVAELLEEQVAVDVYARRRKIFTDGLDAAGLSYAPPEGAFYLFVKAP
ncbi:MAG: pyridoxal phosphate-dependent aminotransferase, partial [Spirochaetota bacterium]